MYIVDHISNCSIFFRLPILIGMMLLYMALLSVSKKTLMRNAIMLKSSLSTKTREEEE